MQMLPSPKRLDISNSLSADIKIVGNGLLCSSGIKNSHCSLSRKSSHTIFNSASLSVSGNHIKSVFSLGPNSKMARINAVSYITGMKNRKTFGDLSNKMFVTESMSTMLFLCTEFADTSCNLSIAAFILTANPLPTGIEDIIRNHNMLFKSFKSLSIHTPALPQTLKEIN